MQLGASLSGTQNGGCFPNIVLHSTKELSETSDEAPRSSSIVTPISECSDSLGTVLEDSVTVITFCLI